MTTIDTNVIHTGDCLDVLDDLPESSVHMSMTSPPYFGLRDYGVDGQFGLEGSIAEYIDNLVQVGNELKRVLRDDGSWWLNLGDSYAGSGGPGGQWTSESSGSAEYAGDAGTAYNGPLNESSLGRKQKMLIPHRVAIALQDAGWIVRNDVTWVKPNPMPQSVKDRLNTTTEQIFHLTPKPDYYYDLDAIREEHQTEEHHKRYHSDGNNIEKWENVDDGIDTTGCHANGKNPGDVFEVTTKPFPDAHFAVYPPELCKKPIKATCPDDGIVLDPFAGAGTTLLKAKELGRKFVGIELNPEYADMARARVGLSPDDPANIRGDDDQQGLEQF